MKVLILKGLPASGKSTFAKDLVDKKPGVYKRINKDDLRAMLDNGRWNKENEEFIIKVRNELIDLSLHEGVSPIIDDTNFSKKHEVVIREIASRHKAEVEVKYFDVPLLECIVRDKKRDKPVGEKVIREMYERYLADKAEHESLVYNPELPDCVICDIDGTLAKMVNRGPFEWTRVGEDELVEPIAMLLKQIQKQNKIRTIIFSGRSDVCYDDTVKWLNDHEVWYDDVFMRKLEDNRKDNIVKQEMYEAHIKGKYNVLWVIDDRNQVVQMWRSLGLTCLQVADGNF